MKPYGYQFHGYHGVCKYGCCHSNKAYSKWIHPVGLKFKRIASKNSRKRARRLLKQSEDKNEEKEN